MTSAAHLALLGLASSTAVATATNIVHQTPSPFWSLANTVGVMAAAMAGRLWWTLR